MSQPRPDHRLQLEDYLERRDPASGQPVAQPIDPEALLISSHRDFHAVDILG